MPSHQQLSVWYGQLAQHLEAGTPLGAALRATAAGSGQSPAVLAMARACEQDGSFEAALRVAADWIPEADRLFLSAAAATGRLPRVLHNLSDRHAQLGSAMVRLILAAAYPLAVLQLGLLLFPLRGMIDWEQGFMWDTSFYLRSVLLTLGPLWLLIISFVLLWRRQSPVLGRLARWLPLLRRWQRSHALAEFSFALGNFLEAGLRIDESWQAAGIISREPELRRVAREVDAIIARGEPPGAHLAGWRVFPAEFVALYQTGEATGQLEQNLLRLATRYQEQAKQLLNVVSLVYPGAIFLLVVALIAYHVVAFFGSYLEMLKDLGTG